MARRTSSDSVRTKPVRKRSRVTRVYAKRRRPKTPAPTTGWILAELAQLTGLPETTVRFYVNQRLIRPSEFRGTITRYQRRELMRLVGILRLKAEGKISLVDTRRKLHSMSDEELEAWLRSGPIPPACAAALGVESAAPPTESAAPTAATAVGVALELGRGVVEHWQRIALLPGLDLMLRSDAKEASRGAAQRIIDEYVVK